MSNAKRQAVRADARESAGNGGADPVSGGGSAFVFCVNLEPTPAEVATELKSHTVLKVDTKKLIAKALLDSSDTIVAKLKQLRHDDAAEAFTRQMPQRITGDNAKNDYLATLFVLLCDSALSPLLDNPNAIQSFTDALKNHINTLKLAVGTARSAARTKRSNEYAKKFFTLKGEQRDRKFCQNGSLPQDEAKRFCLGCNHEGTVDEPDTNKGVIEDNIAKQRTAEEQAEADDAVWQAGGAVTTAKGKTLTKGRRRPAPKLGVAWQECHCEQFGCTSKNGDVPPAECPIRCIDPATGARYVDNEWGSCTCPICVCTCRQAWDVSALFSSCACMNFACAILTHVVFTADRTCSVQRQLPHCQQWGAG